MNGIVCIVGGGVFTGKSYPGWHTVNPAPFPAARPPLSAAHGAAEEREHQNIYNNRNTFTEWYNGRESDIPKEYKIMSFPQRSRPDPSKVEMDAAAPGQKTAQAAEQPQEPRPVIPIVLTSEKPAEKLKEITDRLEQGITELFDSERYKEYLRVMSKFHIISAGRESVL